MCAEAAWFLLVQLSKLSALMRGLHQGVWGIHWLAGLLSTQTHTSLVSNKAHKWPGLNSSCYLLITALRPQSRSAVICRNLRWNSGTLWDSASHTPVTGTTCIKSPHLLSGAFHTHHSLNCFPENATDCVCGLCVHQDDALQGQTEGEPEGHLHRNLGHRVVETHVEFLGDGLEQHPPERQR